MNRALACLAFLAMELMLLLPSPARATNLPDWAERTLTLHSPAASDSAHAHILFHETSVIRPASGRVVTTDRGVVRVLDRRGEDAARVSVPYDQASATVRHLRVWVRAPDGKVRSIGDKDAVDRSLAEYGSLKTDIRVRIIAPDGIEPGAVVAWEWTLDEEPFLGEDLFEFGSIYPIALERFEIQFPAGVEPEVRGWGPSVPAAVRDERGWHWELRDLPALRDEPMSASSLTFTNHLVVWPRPPAGVPGMRFASWQELSRWLVTLSAPSAVRTPALVEKASELSHGRSTPLDRARAIGRFVQGVPYVSVDVGLAHGEGYRPRPADLVLHRGYGDCKDKANLFCTLARAAGLEAWLVSVHNEERDRVHPEWPSPWLFNHCIAALRVPAGSGLAAECDSTPLGPLVFFDPTDANTPLGSLPEDEQGSWALLHSPEHGELLRLPVPEASRTRSVWHVTASLDSTGALRGRWQAQARAGSATRERAWRSEDPEDWRRSFEQSLSHSLGATTVRDLVVDDRPESDAFDFAVEFSTPRYARAIGPGLMTFRTAPLARRDPWSFTDSLRRTPIALRAQSFAETVSVSIPAGWKVDELPAPLSRAFDFGSIAAEWRALPDAVLFTFRAQLDPITLPATRYADIRDWYAERRKAFNAPVVLTRR